jgi:hypothetical protein
MKWFALTLAFCSLNLTVLLAQEEQADSTKPMAGRQVWFAASSIPEGLENPIKVMTEGKITEVMLSNRMASEAVRIPPDGIVSIVREIENPKDPSKPAYQILAKATIAKETHKALIMLVPTGKDGGDGPVFHAKVQDLAAFKGGDYLYLNLTKANVAVQMGSEKITLKPGETSISKAPTSREPVNTPISYHFYHPVREKWQLLSASTVVRMPSRREICVFSWDTRYERLNYHGITFPVAQ